MEQTEILEGNKLIANSNFASDEIIDMLKGAPNRPDKFYINYVSYHDDWELLMPVVEKIESMDTGLIDCRVKIESNLTRVYYFSEGGIDRYEWSNGGVSKILSVYAGVVRFIKWYNSLKP